MQLSDGPKTRYTAIDNPSVITTFLQISFNNEAGYGGRSDATEQGGVDDCKRFPCIRVVQNNHGMGAWQLLLEVSWKTGDPLDARGLNTSTHIGWHCNDPVPGIPISQIGF